MIGIYFSGIGNTKHCVEEFIKRYDNTCTAISIEDEHVASAILEHDMIVFGYPIYYSNAPKIVQDFINVNQNRFSGKKVFIIATMALFSGDGSGCTARIFKKHGAKVVGGLHLKMPDCIGDVNLLKKTAQANRKIIQKADTKIMSAVKQVKECRPPQEGINFLYHMAGLLGQRLWFNEKTKSYKEKPNVNQQRCIGCGRCAQLCPMKNLRIENKKAVSYNRCTLCYRCFSHCPTKALTILGKQVYEQCLFEAYCAKE